MQGNEATSRGQLTTPGYPLFVVIATAIVMIIFDLVELQLESVSFEQQAEQTTTVCASYYGGCDGGPFLVVVFAVTAIVVVVWVGWAILNTRPSGGGSGPSEVTLVQQRYVSGDIETVLQLEDELDAAIDEDDRDDGGDT